MPIGLPAFEIQGSNRALSQLVSGIAGWRVERWGTRANSVWLKATDGTVLLVGVDQRDLTPMFEVFALGVRSMAELREEWQHWQPPAFSEALPEGLREAMTTRPGEPAAPTTFEPWPFTEWQTMIVRRAEFIVEDVEAGQTFGNNPNAQSAARPGRVPDEASAFCEVAAGFLFTGEQGRRLLLAVDWLPFNMVVSEEEEQIDAFLADCEAVDLATYLRQRT